MRPRPPPYLRSPPRTVCLGVGRQLFVDNYLIDAKQTTLRKSWHDATVARLDAVIPDRPWETGGGGRRTARPFGGASLLEPRSQTLILFYRCGWRGKSGKTCVAFSKDGLRFVKPSMTWASSTPTNIVLDSKHVEAFEVAYDHLARPPRFWAFRMEFMTGGSRVDSYHQYESLDGLRWRKLRNESAKLVMADRSSFFLNPLREPPKWVFSLRENLCEGGPSGHMRVRRYWEREHGRRYDHLSYEPFVRKYFQCEPRRPGEPVHWFAVDRHDCGYGECDVYNVDGIAYESILIHGLAILWGPYSGGELKNNSVHLGFSRDGFHIVRPPSPRAPFIRVPETTRALGGGIKTRASSSVTMGISNVQLASGSPVIAGDTLLFYFGYGASEGFSLQSKRKENVYVKYKEGTGVATLRRDGFVGLVPPGVANAAVGTSRSTGGYMTRGGGHMTTRPLVYNGTRLFVNVVLKSGGRLTVTLLPAGEVSVGDGSSPAEERLHATKGSGRGLAEGREDPPVFCGLSAASSASLLGPLDTTRVQVAWPGAAGGPAASSEQTIVGRLSGRRVRLRFSLTDGELFAFWVTHDPLGKSGGYLGGGAFGIPHGVVDR